MPKKNDIARLEIGGLTSEGHGVGRLEGMAVFVPQTVPGELVEVKLLRVEKRYAFGKLMQIIHPSDDRIQPNCPVYQQCGGCQLRHLSFSQECIQKRQQLIDAMQRIGKITLPVGEMVSAGAEDGYRNKAMFPVARVDGQVQIGFYRQHSHQLVDCQDCKLQPPEFSKIAHAVRSFIEQKDITCYDESTGQGLIRHLYLRQGGHSKEILVCLVVNGTAFPEQQALVECLLALSVNITSIALNQNTEITNVVLGEKTTLLHGNTRIKDRMCGLSVALSPESFYQVNHTAAERLYQDARALLALTGNELLLDLYCGIGIIGLSMAKDLRELIGVEMQSQAVLDATQNARENGITNARFMEGDAAVAAEKLCGRGIFPDIVVVDPPRKGCDDPCLLAIAKMAPGRVLMISCNPATAARDCKRLEELGYKTVSVTPYNLFPRTAHVEALILLEKTAQ